MGDVKKLIISLLFHQRRSVVVRTDQWKKSLEKISFHARFLIWIIFSNRNIHNFFQYGNWSILPPPQGVGRAVDQRQVSGEHQQADLHWPWGQTARQEHDLRKTRHQGQPWHHGRNFHNYFFFYEFTPYYRISEKKFTLLWSRSSIDLRRAAIICTTPSETEF